MGAEILGNFLYTYKIYILVLIYNMYKTKNIRIVYIKYSKIKIPLS